LDLEPVYNLYVKIVNKLLAILDMKIKKYPSEISQEKFELIKADLESIRKNTRPREVDLYDILCGVLYVLKSGCQWRMLPSEYPNWNTVYSYFRKWSDSKIGDKTILEIILKKINWRGSYQQFTDREY
jgi:transposase